MCVCGLEETEAWASGGTSEYPARLLLLLLVHSLFPLYSLVPPHLLLCLVHDEVAGGVVVERAETQVQQLCLGRHAQLRARSSA